LTTLEVGELYWKKIKFYSSCERVSVVKFVQDNEKSVCLYELQRPQKTFFPVENNDTIIHGFPFRHKKYSTDILRL
jgi:hypothetical protein